MLNFGLRHNSPCSKCCRRWRWRRLLQQMENSVVATAAFFVINLSRQFISALNCCRLPVPNAAQLQRTRSGRRLVQRSHGAGKTLRAPPTPQPASHNANNNYRHAHPLQSRGKTGLGFSNEGPRPSSSDRWQPHSSPNFVQHDTRETGR